MTDQSHIRNFSIIAHIDHGKSTLSDRLIEKCGAVEEREMEDQILDNMDLERERGITIKARAVGLNYKAPDGESYELNLIDTPGHVDFNYEVSRSLAACEGALLIVDASQGVEAQTLSNTYLALDANLEILPVINKIDLPAADPKRAKQEIEDIIGIPAMDAPEISAKLGLNIDAVMDDIVAHIPAPHGDPAAPLKALVFDSQYDNYRGVIVFIRVFDGCVRKGSNVLLMQTGADYEVLEVGHLRPMGLDPCGELSAGEVGYFTASIKNVADTRIGDTVTDAGRPTAQELPGYRPARSMVYCGIYTEDGSKYPDLRDALEKLKLNDASLSFEPESSAALGFGFRCGFLGMLHMEIIQERLEREFDLDLVTTLPSVIYKIVKTDGSVVMVDNPHNYPDPGSIAESHEPYVKASIITPNEYVGNIMPLCQDRRGEYKDMQYLDTNLVELHYEMPLNEIVYDFFDVLKARTKGYASLDYEFSEYKQSELVKVDMLLNGDQVDALSFIAHKDKAYPRARKLCEKLKDNIPRQLFEIPVQAAIGGKIIARETVKALRKDVLAKCYGGDITRKKKLLEKQKEGKKKMRKRYLLRGRQEEDAAGYRADTHRGLSCRTQAGRRIILLAFRERERAAAPRRKFAALREFCRANSLRPSQSNAGSPQNISFAGQARRRCASWVPCRYPPRPFLPYSSWTTNSSFKREALLFAKRRASLLYSLQEKALAIIFASCVFCAVKPACLSAAKQAGRQVRPGSAFAPRISAALAVVIRGWQRRAVKAGISARRCNFAERMENGTVLFAKERFHVDMHLLFYVHHRQAGHIPAHHVEGKVARRPADVRPVAVLAQLEVHDEGAVLCGQAHKHAAHLVHSVRVRPGDARGTHRHVRAGYAPYPLGHGLGHLVADGGPGLYELRVDAQEPGLHLVGIGDRAAQEKFRRAGYLRKPAGNVAAGAAFG
jgi:GTP-binding protein LepA